MIPWAVRSSSSILALLALSATLARAEPFAYITNVSSNNVSVIDTASNTVTATVPVGIQPIGVAVAPSGGLVYVTNHASGSISVIDAASNTVTATVPAPASREMAGPSTMFSSPEDP